MSRLALINTFMAAVQCSRSNAWKARPHTVMMLRPKRSDADTSNTSRIGIADGNAVTRGEENDRPKRRAGNRNGDECSPPIESKETVVTRNILYK